jgi:hypothetical protein
MERERERGERGDHLSEKGAEEWRKNAEELTAVADFFRHSSAVFAEECGRRKWLYRTT